MLKRVPLDSIMLGKTNPRKNFNGPEWPEFVANIKEHGVIQPGVARPIRDEHKQDSGMVELVIGERRFRASRELKRPDMPLIIRELSDEQAVELQQVENLQREDLTALEEAQGYADWVKRLVTNKTCPTVELAVEYICGKINRKRSSVFNRMALLKLAAPVAAALRAGTIDASKAGLLAQIPDPKLQEKCLKEFMGGTWRGPMSFRQAQEHLAEEYRVSLKDAPFALDADFGRPAGGVFLCPSNGADKLVTCKDCRLRSGNMAKEYPDFAKTPNICTNPPGYKLKVQMHTDATLSRAKSEGRRILPAKEYENHGHQFKEKKDTCYDDPKGRSFGTLAKAANITPAMTVNCEGAAVEVFTPEDVAKIKAANKIRASYSSGGYSRRDLAAQKARQAKEKLMTATLATAIPKILDKLAPNGVLDSRLWSLLAQRTYDSLSIDRHDFTAKRLGISKRVNDSRGALEKYMKQHTSPADCARLVVELLLLSNANGGGWHEVKWDSHVLAAAKLAGVDLQKLMEKSLPQKNTKGAKEKPAKAAKMAAQQHRPTTKPNLMSAANRAKIAAAARARWAKVKAATKKGK